MGTYVKLHFPPSGQRAAAAGMGVIGEKLNVSAVLALGDNFYFSGIIGTENSDRFDHTWDSVYTADSLMRVPWLVIAGNHDYKVTPPAFFYRKIQYSTSLGC
jgi:hypothetical protein